MSNADPQPRAQARLEFLDALRGIAALLVFISHALSSLSAELSHAIYNYFELGNLGVMVFFFCSGYIIPVSIERHGSLRRFWTSRFFRLFPLYWASVVGAFILHAAGLSAIKTGGSIESSLRVANLLGENPAGLLLANLSMLQSFLGFPHLMEIYHTLTFEMVFYLMISGLFVLGMNKKTAPLALSLILVTAMAESPLSALFTSRPQQPIASYIAVMFVGTAFYRLHSGELSGRATGLLAGLGMVMLVGGTLGPGGTLPQGISLALLTARIGACVVLALALLVRHRQFYRWLLWLGKVSYSLYLCHPFVLVLVPAAGGVLPSLLVWSAVLLPLCALTYRYIEEPAMALGKQLSRPQPQATPSPT